MSDIPKITLPGKDCIPGFCVENGKNCKDLTLPGSDDVVGVMHVVYASVLWSEASGSVFVTPNEPHKFRIER